MLAPPSCCYSELETLLEAKIIFALDEAHTSDTSATESMMLQISAEARGESSRLSSDQLISERLRTSVSVAWSPAAVDGETTTLETPDLSEMVAEVHTPSPELTTLTMQWLRHPKMQKMKAQFLSLQVLSIGDWHEGNSLAFLFEETADGVGERWVKSDATAHGEYEYAECCWFTEICTRVHSPIYAIPIERI